MSPLGRQRPPRPSDQEQQAAEVDLERIRQGGIPLGAEQRLKRVAAASTPFFTSDLSAKEYALAQASGLRPLAQVMGSSVVQHGWAGSQMSYYNWSTGEVTALSEPWNLARTRAFDRLRQEAQLAGADGVIGIELSVSGSLGELDNVEYVVFGTAVRDEAFDRVGGSLSMCTLSGQDVDKLRRVGAEPRGVVGHTTVVAVALAPNSNYMLNASGWLGGAAAMNAEIREITEGVYEARRRAMSELRRQADALGAGGIVVSNLSHTIGHREYEQAAGIRYHYFFVTMHVLGTAIQLGAHAPHPTPLNGPIMSINLGD